MRRSLGTLVLAAALLGAAGVAAAAPSGQMTLVHGITIAPRWFDPAESEGLVTPFIFYYAIHDALVKPMPGQPMAPCLAESWRASADGLTYEFVLRKGARFHNGDPVTADDVKFSFERIQQLIHDKVMYAPLLELAIPGGYGPRVAESAIGLITNMSSSAPYEELRLKGP